ncbi:MAG: M20/M25/M40 family metallo-hydrolase [Veillonella sp.]|nr:M20/M25/M40 family metallo-hydrolase [Veillonella sp.]
MNKALVAKVEEYVLAHREEIVKTFEELINIKDFWRDVDGVNAVGEWLKDAFEAEGFECELVEFSPQAGKLLTGTLGAHRSGAPIMFAGHMDTALASDLYEDNPFRIEDGCAYGPGVLDMKGGIIIALYVVKALNAIGYADRPIKIMFAPDEEGLHNYTTVAEYIKEHSSGCLFALNMETGLMDNGLAVGRKGRLGIDVFVTGKSAHAGAAFEDGISAIVEMAQKVMAFQALTDLAKGTTVNIGTINGGTIPNAVPGECMCQLDVRFTTADEMNRVKAAIDEICNTSYVPGTTCTYKELNAFTPFETNDAVMKLYNFMAGIAKSYGYADTKPTQVGGCSDATFIQAAGTPVLCSCGVRGNWNHTLREFAEVESLYDRIKWYSAAIIDAEELAV